MLESLKCVLNTGNIEFEYAKPIDEKQSEEKAAIEAALSRLAIKELRIRDAYENGIDSLDEYRMNKERLQAERDSLNQELENFTPQKSDIPPSIQKAEIMKGIRSACNLISNPDIEYEVKGMALRRIVKKITYHRNENRMEFHYYI